MLQKIKNLMMALALPLALAAPLALAPAVSAAPCSGIQGSINQGVNNAVNGSAGCTTTSQSGISLQSVASRIVNFLSVIVGIVAVIMIIVGGFRYITSGGESGNVSGAKNTLIYAIVGLIIVALAQFIVHFVLTTLPPVDTVT